jgi:hypothetical protein
VTAVFVFIFLDFYCESADMSIRCSCGQVFDGNKKSRKAITIHSGNPRQMYSASELHTTYHMDAKQSQYSNQPIKIPVHSF